MQKELIPLIQMLFMGQKQKQNVENTSRKQKVLYCSYWK